MKSVMLMFAFLFVVAGATAQDYAQAFRTGNYRVISSAFNANVELDISGNEGFYSKAQAEQILKDFMVRNPPRNFVQRHAGFSRDGNQYLIGTIETATANYRTYLFLQKIGEVTYIKEMRIEREH